MIKKNYLLLIEIILFIFVISSCNAPPVISSVSHDKDVCTFNESITLEVDAFDPNNDVISTSWSLSGYGEIVVDNDDDTIAVFTSGTTAGTAIVTIQVTDGKSPSVSQDAQITVVESQPPSVPTGLNIDDSTTSSITISWDSVSDADSYQLFRSDSEDGTYASIVSDLDATTFDDTDLSSNTTYYYKIKAVNSDGASGFSAIVSGTTDVDVSSSLSAPEITISSGIYIDSVSVTISTSFTGAKVLYTIDGTDPITNGIDGNDSITLNISTSTEIRAITTSSGYSPSSETEASYLIFSESHFATGADIRYMDGTFGSDGNLHLVTAEDDGITLPIPGPEFRYRRYNTTTSTWDINEVVLKQTAGDPGGVGIEYLGSPAQPQIVIASDGEAPAPFNGLIHYKRDGGAWNNVSLDTNAYRNEIKTLPNGNNIHILYDGPGVTEDAFLYGVSNGSTLSLTGTVTELEQCSISYSVLEFDKNGVPVIFFDDDTDGPEKLYFSYETGGMTFSETVLAGTKDYTAKSSLLYNDLVYLLYNNETDTQYEIGTLDTTFNWSSKLLTKSTTTVGNSLVERDGSIYIVGDVQNDSISISKYDWSTGIEYTYISNDIAMGYAASEEVYLVHNNKFYFVFCDQSDEYYLYIEK